jgi:hypothetical protein
LDKRKKDRKPLGFMDLYRKIRKDLPGPTQVEEPKRGTGHSYSKRDRRDWKRGK